MIKIIKGESPEFFEEWKKDNRGRKFSDFKGKTRRELKNTLISEQKGLCCYCCASITYEKTIFEHIKPQERYKEFIFSYNNLLASCEGFDEEGFTCGHNKDNWYDEKLFISPLSDDCEEYFTYLLNGRIEGSGLDDKSADETIYRLYLNSYELTNARKAVIEMILYSEEIIENLKEEIEFYRTPNASGNLEPFCNAIIFALEYLLKTAPQ
jgi:uncharacterized protein (TIGR02646 family)